ncbi:hypothetical protein PybrP1_000292 [[Pythium] brassicae (nom. inval.)]|nr:hypothetical protein PybrP1_000292 [[Pythium] brassicae (nom. inval.)]
MSALCQPPPLASAAQSVLVVDIDKVVGRAVPLAVVQVPEVDVLGRRDLERMVVRELVQKVVLEHFGRVARVARVTSAAPRGRRGARGGGLRCPGRRAARVQLRGLSLDLAHVELAQLPRTVRRRELVQRLVRHFEHLVHLERVAAREDARLVELEQRESDAEQHVAALAEEHVPDPEHGLKRQRIEEEAEEPLEPPAASAAQGPRTRAGPRGCRPCCACGSPVSAPRRSLRAPRTPLPPPCGAAARRRGSSCSGSTRCAGCAGCRPAARGAARPCCCAALGPPRRCSPRARPGTCAAGPSRSPSTRTGSACGAETREPRTARAPRAAVLQHPSTSTTPAREGAAARRRAAASRTGARAAAPRRRSRSLTAPASRLYPHARAAVCPRRPRVAPCWCWRPQRSLPGPETTRAAGARAPHARARSASDSPSTFGSRARGASRGRQISRSTCAGARGSSARAGTKAHLGARAGTGRPGTRSRTPPDAARGAAAPAPAAAAAFSGAARAPRTRTRVAMGTWRARAARRRPRTRPRPRAARARSARQRPRRRRCQTRRKNAAAVGSTRGAARVPGRPCAFVSCEQVVTSCDFEPSKKASPELLLCEAKKALNERSWGDRRRE